jgi:hypothetical protein
MLIVNFMYYYAGCCCAECSYAKCSGAKPILLTYIIYNNSVLCVKALSKKMSKLTLLQPCQYKLGKMCICILTLVKSVSIYLVRLVKVFVKIVNTEYNLVKK